MNDVDRAFSDYVQAHRELGGVDARNYLGRLESTERPELAALIDAYLTRQTRRRFDPDEFAGSYADTVCDGLHRALQGQAGMWPVALPMLRKQAGLTKEDLVPRLASALGAPHEQAKIGAYYHEMEHGALGAWGVSDRVLSALADIVDTTPAALRAAGATVEGEAGGARAGTASRRAIEASGWLSTPSDPTWNEVDELFHSG